MRWVFIKPKNQSPYYDPEIQEPLGLEYLAAARRARGDAVLILAGDIQGADNIKTARRAAAFQPDAIGFSLTTVQDVDSLLEIHAECQRALRGQPCRWLSGGNFITTEPGRALTMLPAHFFLIQCEGESALDFLVRQWGTCSPVANTDPPASRLIQGHPVENLDSLPFPSRDFASRILGSGWAFNLQGSRGCRGACRYCSSPGMSGASRNRWRGRTPAHVVAEMEYLQRTFGARSFNFVDEDFLGTNRRCVQRAAEFVGALERRKLRVSFSIQVRPDSLTEEIIDRLAQAGLTYVFMGIESDSPEDLKRWGRPWRLDPWRLAKRLRQCDVALNAGVMLFHPHATLAGIRRFAEKLHHCGLLEYRSARNRLDAMPGSFYHREGIASGQLKPDISGPQSLPFINPAVEGFYNDLLTALDPLGPSSMHALCALPPLLAAQRFDERNRARCRELKSIIAEMDGVVAATFFTLLDAHQHERASHDFVRQLFHTNMEKAFVHARKLVDCAFAPSFEELIRAIRLDTESE